MTHHAFGPRPHCARYYGPMQASKCDGELHRSRAAPPSLRRPARARAQPRPRRGRDRWRRLPEPRAAALALTARAAPRSRGRPARLKIAAGVISHGRPTVRAVPRRDARVRRVQQHSVADRLGELVGSARPAARSLERRFSLIWGSSSAASVIRVGNVCGPPARDERAPRRPGRRRPPRAAPSSSIRRRPAASPETAGAARRQERRRTRQGARPRPPAHPPRAREHRAAPGSSATARHPRR